MKVRLIATAIIGASLLLGACAKKAENFTPLPPIGTKAMWRNTQVATAVDNNGTIDVDSSMGTRYFCQLSVFTPIRSVYNAKNGREAYFLVEDDSSRDPEYSHRIGQQYKLCRKGAVVALDAEDIPGAVQLLVAMEVRQKEDRKTKDAISKELAKE